MNDEHSPSPHIPHYHYHQIEDEEFIDNRDYSGISADKNEMISQIKSLMQVVLKEGEDLSPDEREDLQKLLVEYWDVFALNPNKPSTTDLVLHEIDTGDHPPINVRPYPIPKAHEEIAAKMIQEMAENKIIQWTKDSPWGFPIVLVPKPDGKLRFCVDYRKLNAITRTSSYPIPLISELMDCFHGAKYFSSIDLASGYWQIRMHENSIEKTTFNSKWGSFFFNVMPFGLVKAPATFQSLMDRIFRDVQWKSVCVYFDDIFIFSKTFPEHLQHIREVLSRLRQHSLQGKISKCNFVKKDIRFLGHIISSKGIRPDPEKVKSVKEWRVPKSKKDIRRFIGLCSYYRKFIPHFATVAAPLHALQSTSKSVIFQWGPEQQQAFEFLKERLISAPILVSPDWTQSFTLQTDSSQYGVGAVLCQVIDGEERVVAYASKSLSKAQKNYMTSDRECYAIIWGIKHFRSYLIGRKFDLLTDHAALQFLNTMRLNRDLSGRLARYQMFLQEYDFQPQYRKGKLNDNADALSREPIEISSIHNVEGASKPTPTDPQSLDLSTLQTEPQLTDLPSTSELILFQRQESGLQHIINTLLSDASPEDRMTAQKELSIKEKKDISNGRYYLQADGLLLRKMRFNYEDRNCVVIPQKMRAIIMHHMHADTNSAHQGLHKTYERTALRFFWRGMFRDIEDYVASCRKCQQRKHPKRPAHPPSVSHVPSEGPWREIAFDAVGPFPETDDGNKHILVFMDRFTKSCELFAVKDLKESTVAQIIVNEIVPRHGCPATILTDRAASFNSELLQQIYALLNTRKLNTSAYNPQQNGQVERFNETLVVMISMYVSKHQTDWDKHLNILRGAYMSAPHPVTGYTPNYLEYGRELKLPLETVISAKEFYLDREDFLSKILQRTSFAQDLARARLLNRKIELEEKQEMSTVQLEYKFGEKVLIFVPDSKVNLSNKLLSRWIGPFTVVERTSPVNYRVVQHLPNNISDIRMVNVRRMKPYHQGSELSQQAHALGSAQPDNVQGGGERLASMEDEEYEVEAILDRKLLYRKLHYLIKWRGYDMDSSTWEPLENLVNSSVLIEEFDRKYSQMHAKPTNPSTIPLRGNQSERILRRRK